jgi:pimeloyl-ACP methyl ester carboxylesterase
MMAPSLDDTCGMWFAVVATALVAGIVVQAICVRRDRRRFAPIGRLIDGLHVREAGRHGPSVVFEAGRAAGCLNWSRVQTALATRARTCSYDRAGLGWSRPARGDRSLRALTDDLHGLIHALELPAPLVLAGHSFGTFIVRVYAHRFPGEVSALVLVDPVTPEEFSNPTGRTRLRLWRAAAWSYAAAALAVCGLIRVGLWGLLRRGPGNPGPVLGMIPTFRRMAAEVGKLPREAIPELRARWSGATFFLELAASIRALPACAAEVSRQPVPHDMPVVVLSGAHRTPEHLIALEALATRHVIVQGSAHWIHLDQPSLVAEAVLEAASDAGRAPS